MISLPLLKAPSPGVLCHIRHGFPAFKTCSTSLLLSHSALQVTPPSVGQLAPDVPIDFLFAPLKCLVSKAHLLLTIHSHKQQ